MKGLNPLVEYSFDRDDYLRDFRIDESREQDRIEAMQRESFEEEFRKDAERDRANAAVREVVNNRNIKIDQDLKNIINDDKMVMDERGRIRKLDRGQFNRASMLMGIPLPTKKRTRRKTKMDKTMSKCLKMANQKMRKKNGQLRKGKTMKDVMRLAHRLCKKE